MNRLLPRVCYKAYMYMCIQISFNAEKCSGCIFPMILSFPHKPVTSILLTAPPCYSITGEYCSLDFYFNYLAKILPYRLIITLSLLVELTTPSSSDEVYEMALHHDMVLWLQYISLLSYRAKTTPSVANVKVQYM